MSNSMAHQNNPWEDIDTLCDYIEGNLSEGDHKNIKSEIARSEYLSSKIEGIKYFFDGKKVDRGSLKEFLDQTNKYQEKIISEHFAKKNANRTFGLTKYAIAAMILLLFGLGIGFLLINPQSPSPQLIAEQSLSTPYQFSSSQIRGSNASSEIKGLRAYQAGNYQTAISELTSISSPNEQESFILALSYLYAKSHEEAQIHFQSILDRENVNSLYADQSRWYLILSYLSTNEISKAQAIMNEVIEGEKTHYRYGEIESLLQNLSL